MTAAPDRPATAAAAALAPALAIVGTDTDAGKTVLTAALAAYWLARYPDRSLGILKPVQAGPGDREFYRDRFDLGQTPEQLNPIALRDPLAPPLAAAREGATIDLGLAWRSFSDLRRQRSFVLVEGAGGLGSPLTAELTVADLCRDWRLPAVLVVPVRLGAIAQAVANAALAREARVRVRGLVLNCVVPRSPAEVADWTPPELMASLTGLPVLGCLPHLADPGDRAALARAAAGLDLEALLPDAIAGKPLSD